MDGVFHLLENGIFPVDIKTNNIMFREENAEPCSPVLIDLDNVPVVLENKILIPEHTFIDLDHRDDYGSRKALRTQVHAAQRREIDMLYWVPYGWPNEVRNDLERATVWGAIDVVMRTVLNCFADDENWINEASTNLIDPHVARLLESFEEEWIGRVSKVGPKWSKTQSNRIHGPWTTFLITSRGSRAGVARSSTLPRFGSCATATALTRTTARST